MSTTSGKIDKFNNVFSTLKRSYEGELGLQIACVSLRSEDKIDVLVQKNKVDLLKPVDMFTANSRGCLPLTRIDLIDFITSWAIDPSFKQQKNVLWLWGFSGSGKSTLMRTIAERFWAIGRLGAFLLFDRKSAEIMDPNVVIRTLAYKLALFDDQIGGKVASAIDRNRDIIQRSFSEQFLKLIVEPLESIDLRIAGPILVILDALDECGDEKSRELLLSAFAEGSAKLPMSFRILVTSRPEPDIKMVFDPLPHILSHELSIKSESNTHDISLFIQCSMRDIAKDRHWTDWPGRKQIDDLTTKADGLFIWASTACQFIKAGTKNLKNVNHDKLLKQVLSDPAQVEGQKTIDALYSTVLNSLLDWDDEAEVKKYHLIIGTMVAEKTLLSAKAITALHKPEIDVDAIDFVQPLSSLLSVTSDDTGSSGLEPLHKSFYDFLADDKRSGKFFIDNKQHSGRLAKHCLNRMILFEQISSNVEPLKLNSNINSKTDPPEDLKYACRFWSEHLIDGGDDSLYDLVSIFANKCLLFWIEQLAITLNLDSAIGSLIRAKAWLNKFRSGDDNIARLIFDAERLVRAHFEDIRDSSSCVYTTALPFSPKKSLIRYTYRHALAGRINVVSGIEDEWGPCLLNIKLNSRATCVAWSHDGTYVVCGLANGVVVVHHTQTGSLHFSYPGHQVVEEGFPILAVAFSPDNSYILSASANGFLRKWDISGKTLAQVDCGPLKHVSFTFHLGGYAACVSDEGSLQLRELERLTVTTVHLTIPETDTTCVEFSPHGSETPAMAYTKGGHLGMWDLVKNVSLWVVPIDSLLQGEGSISDDDDEHSVDGTHERESHNTQEPTEDDVSASYEIKLTSSNDSGTAPDISFHVSFNHFLNHVLNHLREIQGPVNPDDTVVQRECISVSKDGYVAFSPANDGPIFVFRNDGTPHGQLRAPNQWKSQRYCPSPVRSLVFSPDGTHLLVGHSWTRLVNEFSDTVIRMWSVESRDLVAVIKGHFDRIESLAFLPGSEHRLSSASYDKTIRIWDLKTAMTTVSFDAHQVSSSVYCIAFSPNGKQIATTSYDFDVKVWDAESGSSRTISGHRNSWVLCVSFAPDSNTFATCSIDGRVMIWQAESLERLQCIYTGNKAYNLAHSPLDGRLIAVSFEDHSVRVWDVADMKQPKDLLHTNIGKPEARPPIGDKLGLSMNGKYVALVHDKEAYVWDIETKALILHVQGVDSQGGLIFSKDDTHLVTFKPMIKIWNIETGQLLQTLPDSAAQLTCSPLMQGYLHSLDPQVFDVSQYVQQDVVFTALSPFSFSNPWVLDRNGRKIFRYRLEGEDRNPVSWGHKIAFGTWDGVVTIIHVPDEDASQLSEDTEALK